MVSYPSPTIGLGHDDDDADFFIRTSGRTLLCRGFCPGDHYRSARSKVPR
jgi:hypothetical protein